MKVFGIEWNVSTKNQNYISFSTNSVNNLTIYMTFDNNICIYDH